MTINTNDIFLSFAQTIDFAALSCQFTFRVRTCDNFALKVKLRIICHTKSPITSILIIRWIVNEERGIFNYSVNIITIMVPHCHTIMDYNKFVFPIKIQILKEEG